MIQNIVGASQSYGLAVGDVDGDGDLDIVFPSIGTNGSILMENRGDTDGNGQLDFTRTALAGVNTSWDAEFVRIGGGSGAREDGPAVTIAFVGDDVDSDDDRASLTYTITSAPAEGTVVNNGNGTFSFSPGAGFQDLGRGETRTVTFTYTATDSRGAVSSPATITLAVAGTNDGPVATVDAASTAPNTAVTINVRANDTDVDGDVLTVSHINGVAIAINQTVSVANGTVRLNADMTLTFQPATSFNGQASFTYSISDGNGGTSTSTVGVSVTPQPSGAPVLSAKDMGPVTTSPVINDKAPATGKASSDPVVLPGVSDVSGVGKAGDAPVVLPGGSDISEDDKASDGPVVLPGATVDLVFDRSINRDGDPSLTVMEDGGILGDVGGSFDLGLGDADADVFVVPGELVDTPLVLPGEAGVDRFDIGTLSDLFTGRDGDLPLTVMDDGSIVGGSDGFGSTLNFEVQAPGDDGFLITGDLVDQPLVLPGETTGEAFGFDPMSDLFTARAGESPLTVTEDGQILGGEPLFDANGLYNWA